MKTQTQHLTINGHHLEVVWHGAAPEDAPTLVFLHEGLGCAVLWRDFPAKLADATGCGALVYSRLGYGNSDSCDLPRPVSYMHDEGLEVLPELLRVAGIQECILIGHSDGGSIALIYAGGTAAIPLRGVITEAAHVFCEDISVQSIQKIKSLYIKDGELRRKLAKYHGENVDCAFWGWNQAWLNPDFREWNIEDYLPQINVPVLAIQGIEDQYATAAQIDAIVNQTGDGTEVLMLSECGHAPHKEQKEATFDVMMTFIKRVLQDK